jgi:acetyl esterase/lipase
MIQRRSIIASSIRAATLATLAWLAAAPAASAAATAEGVSERLPLWPGPAPIGDGRTDPANATLTVHHPAKPDGTALVICPGGGYGTLVSGPEGHGIAAWLGAHGITGAVLEYRLPAGRPLVPLLDAQRAIRLVRANAAAWGLDPARIGIIGFSAGGHLAASAGTHFDGADLAAMDPLAPRISSRPDFMVLVYPVITLGPKGHAGTRTNLLGRTPDPELVGFFSNETQVTARTPPAYIAHAKDDQLVPVDNSRDFHAALQAHHVASEFLELPSGGHGLNGYQGPMWTAWQEGALAWLAAQKLIPPESAR